MYALLRRGDHFEMVETGEPVHVGSPDLAPVHKGADRIWQQCSRTEKQAWDRYVRTGSVEDALIRNSILQSWERCRDADVDPTEGTGWDFASFNDLEESHGHLIEVSSPITETLYQCVRGTGFVIVLTNPDGYILKTLGDADTLLRADKLNFGPGANWSEGSVGTNAIGTALALHRPIEVTGTEHYCETHHLWTCSAAPITDPAGQLLGCLDISGPRENAHPHLMGMALAAVRAIENRLHTDLSHAQLEEAYRHLTAIFDSVSDGIITISPQGYITNINSAAARILRLSREEALGRDASAVLGVDQPVGRMLENGRLEAEELVLRSKTGEVRCVARSRPVGCGSKAGAVIAVRELKNAPVAIRNRSGSNARYTFQDIIGESRAIRNAIERAEIIADSPSTVLLLGESGTGKEVFAQAIHNASERRNGPFVAVNCAAVPKDLIQSELFGYEAGAFTGARKGGRVGKLEAANRGTLFLDEIGDMPLEMQTNLLRVLEERTVVRIGGNRVIPVDVRVIAATHSDLQQEVKKERFRKDLFYRLSVISLALPPLRERKEDVPVLADHFTGILAQKLGKRIRNIDDTVLECLSDYTWPGNVRELVNVLEQAVNMVQDEELLPEHLPVHLRRQTAQAFAAERTRGAGEDVAPLATVEKWAIERALVRYRGNITKVAKALGVSRNTLYEKMKRYEIRR